MKVAQNQPRPAFGQLTQSNVIELERWLTKKELAAHLGCGIRFIEYRMAEGLPHALIAGKAKFKASEVEAWLEQTGHLERRVG